MDITRNGMSEFAVELSRAQTFQSVAEMVKRYCSRVFGSRAGMIFRERQQNIELMFEWQSRNLSKKHGVAERLKTGPVAQVFRRREPIFWSNSHSRVLFPGNHSSVGFLPMGNSTAPDGVLAI